MAAILLLLGGTALAAGLGPSRAADSVAPPSVRPEVPVTAMDIEVGPANNSPAILVDPTDDRFVVMPNRLDAPGFGCALQVSGNGGASWVTASPIAALPTGAERCYAPEAGFDADGTLYFLFVGLHGVGNEPIGVFLTKSRDRAATWSTPRQVLPERNFGVRMAIDRQKGPKGRIHLVWLHATSDPPLGGYGPPPNPIMAAHSDDGGRSFSTPVQVSDKSRRRVVAPNLAVAPDGSVHAAYYDLQDDVRDYQGLEGPVWDGNWSVVVTSSDGGGRRFGPGVVVDDSVRPWARPMLIYTLAPPALVAADRGRLCAAWTDARHGDADALVSCSGERGRSWSKPGRLNDDLAGNGRSQYLPQLALSPEGRLDAVFYDRRHDPENISAHVSFTSSTDWGRRWRPNVRVTAEPSDSRIGQRYTNVSANGQYEVGSRLALLSRPARARVAWADTRHSTVTNTSQDIFTTSVILPEPDREPVWPRIVGVALTGAGVAVLVASRRRKASS